MSIQKSWPRQITIRERGAETISFKITSWADLCLKPDMDIDDEADKAEYHARRKQKQNILRNSVGFALNELAKSLQPNLFDSVVGVIYGSRKEREGRYFSIAKTVRSLIDTGVIDGAANLSVVYKLNPDIWAETARFLRHDNDFLAVDFAEILAADPNISADTRNFVCGQLMLFDNSVQDQRRYESDKAEKQQILNVPNNSSASVVNNDELSRIADALERTGTIGSGRRFQHGKNIADFEWKLYPKILMGAVVLIALLILAWFLGWFHS